MFVTPAFAQATGGAGGTEFLVQFAPFILIFVIMYFLLIRPQQRKAKEHKEMLKNLRRGDVVVMQGGIIGKITKVVDDSEILIDAGDGTTKVQIRVASALVQQLRSKGEPVKEGA